ncbi:tyrosine-type recombinase/integrase [Paraburkholderia xenovorans]|uniref:tyrosine-type recombinase/integrase n=1 Tax=Paraburkholderia xenovorans TaxID=36873 RepID=UPI0038BB0A74
MTKFDAKRAKSLQPKEHIAFDDFPGLRLEATKTRRTWTYRFKSPVDGNMRQVKLGSWPAMPLPAAVAEWEAQRSARDAGADPALAKREARNGVLGADARTSLLPDSYLVKHVVADYLAGHVEHNASASVLRNTRYALGEPILPIIDMTPESITRQIAFKLLEGLRDRPTYANRIKGELAAAWDYGLDAGRIKENTPNWWRQIMRGKLRSKGRTRNGERVTEKRILSDREIAAVVPWLPVLGEDVSDVSQMYLWTGQRGNEIVAMRGDELTEEADGLWWTIPKSKTKNKRVERATAHRVPLFGRAEKIIRRRWAKYGAGYLFPYTAPKTGRRAAKDRKHITQASIGQIIARCQPYWEGNNPITTEPPIPVTGWTPHDLRRTARTMIGSMGCVNDIGEEIIGHVKPGVVGIYNLYEYDSEKREWLTKLAGRLESLVAV